MILLTGYDILYKVMKILYITRTLPQKEGLFGRLKTIACFCLLTTLANSLDPNQAQRNVYNLQYS